MARIRTIKPEFWSDEKLSPLPIIDRLVFLALMCLADDAGRLVDNVKMLNGQIFSFTEDDVSRSLEVLASIGRIERGNTASGQAVIQVVNWNKHQRIDKPNLKGALPPIVGHPRVVAETSTMTRQAIPESVRRSVWDRFQGKCAECGVDCKRHKDDKYDSDPLLGEIDHIVAVADGGTENPQNLQLLCLSHNRKKAGAALIERNRRALAESSPKPRGGTPEPTYDQRPTTSTNDLLTELIERPSDNSPVPTHRSAKGMPELVKVAMDRMGRSRDS